MTTARQLLAQLTGLVSKVTRKDAGDLQAGYYRYVAPAREAASLGDVVQMEHWYQHAERYFRTMKANTA